MNHRLHSSIFTVLSLIAVAASAGCAAQVDPSYEGEALAMIGGRVDGEASPDAAEPVAALVWSKGGGELLASSTSAEVSGAFPRRFNLTIRDVPPDEVLTQGVAFAYIAALRPDASPTTQDEMLAAMLGASDGHLVVYAEHDIDGDSTIGRFFGAPLASGYHLLRVREYTTQEKDANRTCRANATAKGKDPKTACPAFKMHVALAPLSEEVSLELWANGRGELPDLG